MAHFYGFIQGQAGDATRMGSKRSGYRAWAQTTQGRIEVELTHIARPNGDHLTPDIGGDGEVNLAHVTITGGQTTYYRSRTLRFNLTNVPAALDCGDPKIDRIWARIEADFAKLDREAPKAIARAERKRAAERRKAAREAAERGKLVDKATDNEIEIYMAERGMHNHEYARVALRSDDSLIETERGHLIVKVTDWDTDSGLREVDLTKLARSLPVRTGLNPDPVQS